MVNCVDWLDLTLTVSYDTYYGKLHAVFSLPKSAAVVLQKNDNWQSSCAYSCSLIVYWKTCVRPLTPRRDVIRPRRLRWPDDKYCVWPFKQKMKLQCSTAADNTHINQTPRLCVSLLQVWTWLFCVFHDEWFAFCTFSEFNSFWVGLRRRSSVCCSLSSTFPSSLGYQAF